jgi:maleylacetate reductase
VADHGGVPMMPFVHDLTSGRVVFGAGSLTSVPSEVARLGGTRVLLISDEFVKAVADEVAEDLGSRVVRRVTEVVQHVPVELADAVAATARNDKIDVVVCVGGGSATGLAKAVALRHDVRILAVPTTYAGSEMTPIWGLTADAEKRTGRDPRVLPRAVVYDPVLTYTMPPSLSAASGLNAMAHSVETLYAADASPVVRLIAEESIRALAHALPGVVDRPNDADARAEALYGAWLAGMSLGNATMGIHHKVCHTLGGAYNLPHAAMHAALLPYAAAFNRPAAPEAMRALARALHADDGPTGLWDLAQSIGAPTSLLDVGFEPAYVGDASAIIARANITTPRHADQVGISRLLHAALDGSRPVAGTDL